MRGIVVGQGVLRRDIFILYIYNVPIKHGHKLLLCKARLVQTFCFGYQAILKGRGSGDA